MKGCCDRKRRASVRQPLQQRNEIDDKAPESRDGEKQQDRTNNSKQCWPYWTGDIRLQRV